MLLVSPLPLSPLLNVQQVRLNQDTVQAACSAQEQPSLLLRDDSIQLLPGPLSQLTDDW